MTRASEPTPNNLKSEINNLKSSADAGSSTSIAAHLEIPWRGLRPDLVLHAGPVDHDGQRTWVLEDPLRGNNYRLGYIEGELVYRLTVEPDLDRAVAHLYATTGLRPPLGEILGFIRMLQREALAHLPESEAVRRDAAGGASSPSLIDRLMAGAIFFRVPLVRPDRFLSRTLPWVSGLWSPVARWIYLLCGLLGLALTLQEIELYLGTVSYLFTPQGALAFIFCLVALKVGHELAHAYTAKAMGLHVRSMGLFFIVIWPLLYTDTTDAWKIPDRRRRIWISAAGVLFELAVAGIALLLWAVFPDGILRSLMFFLSGASLISSILINLNPFMRYDGYYLLMDWWGIDNLRPRAFAMLRYAVRRALFDWRGPVPEIHPQRRAMIVYGFFAIVYRILVGLSIAIAVYYLFFPALGLMVFAAEIWLFIIRPGWNEVAAIFRNRSYIGSRRRTLLTLAGLVALVVLVAAPLPRSTNLPGLLLFENASRLEAAVRGEITLPMPGRGQRVAAGDLLTRIESETLTHEARMTQYDLAGVRASIAGLGGGGGEQRAYRNWLQAEEERLMAALAKLREAISLLEIRAPFDGVVTEVNEALYVGGFVSQGTYLLTVADPAGIELKIYVHENQVSEMTAAEGESARVRLPAVGVSADVRFEDKSRFPVHYLPNESLLDVAGGPIASVADTEGERPRDAYYAFTYSVVDPPPDLPHGIPAWLWAQGRPRSLAGTWIGWIWRHVLERGLW